MSDANLEGGLPGWARDLFVRPRDGAALRWDGAGLVAADGERFPVEGGVVDLRDARARAGRQDAAGEQSYWEAAAAQYDADVLQTHKPHARRRIERMVRSVLAPTAGAPGARTLEVGTGTGDMTRHHLEAGRRVVGIDLSIEMLRLARRRLGDRSDLVLVACDMLDLPFRDGAFDAAIGLGVLHHAPDDLPRFFAGLRRVLRPGGRCAFREPSYDNLFNRWYFDWRRSPTLSPNEMPLRDRDLVRWARGAGFDGVRARLDGLVLPQMPAPVAWVAERAEPVVRRLPLLDRLVLGGIVLEAARPADG